MAAGVAFIVVIAAMIVLAIFGDRDTIAGLTPQEFAGLSFVVALGIPFLQRIKAEYGGQWRKGMQALAFWLGAIVLIVGLHSYRLELSEVAHRVFGAFTPGSPIATRDGEVRFTRQDGGSFVLAGRVNGQSVRFVFDTGATAVVLTSSTAERAGLKIDESDYRTPVLTANGRTLAAPVRLAELAIGPIRQSEVRALVAKPGALQDNLLGMTFLERLQSYRVEGDQLILRAP